MAMLIPQNLRARPGFTLVELMVSAAVCVIIMAVLATVFQSSIDTMRDMRAIGGLQDQLRAAQIMMERDLQADHFVPKTVKNSKNQLISGPTLPDQRLMEKTWQPPAGGFFRVESDGLWSQYEGVDADGLDSTRSKDPKFVLHFTSILKGGKTDSVYTASTSTNQTISSRAAEIAYFLDPTVSGNTGTANLYKLIRRQRLVAETPDFTNSLMAGDPETVAMNSAATKVYTLAEVRDPSNRMNEGGALAPMGAIYGHAGDDVLLSNVISFEVLANWDDGTTPHLFHNYFQNVAVGDTGTNTGIGGNVFDTGFPNAGLASVLPGNADWTKRVRLTGLQIKLRIYDTQLHRTRQQTIPTKW
jgi:type II secretory pathway pseudopilin PulG